ncbi:Translation initiation factor 3 subunit c [Sorochytrium milnesiophthora]
MSRFFKGDSSASSDSDFSSEEEEEQVVQQQPTQKFAKPTRAAASDSDSGDNVKRVVKSSKDKRSDEILQASKAVSSALKQGDWATVSNEFEKLGKLIAKQTQSNESISPLYIRTLNAIDDGVTDQSSNKKPLTGGNNKAFSGLKTKLRKLTKTYETQMATLRSTGVPADEESEGESEAAAAPAAATPTTARGAAAAKAPAGARAAAKAKPAAAKKAAAPKKSKWMAKATSGSDSDSDSESSDESDSSDEESDSESESGSAEASDSDDFDFPSGDDESESDESEIEEHFDPNNRRARWVKKDWQPDSANQVKKPTVPAEGPKAPRAPKKPQPGTKEGDEAETDDFHTIGKSGKAILSDKDRAIAAANALMADATPENLMKKLRDIIQARGKKGTDRDIQILMLRHLLSIAATPQQKIKVTLVLIASHFDYSTSASLYLAIPHWKSAHEHVVALLDTLDSNPEIVVTEEVDEDEELTIMADINGKPAADAKPAAVEERTQIKGSMISFIDRLDDEFTRSLQNIDPHTPEFIERLRDELALYGTIVRVELYLRRIATPDPLNRCILRRVEHLYYKPDDVNRVLEQSVQQHYERSGQTDRDADPSSVVHSLCVHLYNNAAERMRARAILCHVYHHALHERFHKARDMLLMSHVQETIQHADVPTQILYNRSMVQLGLCAFRQGLIKDAHAMLQEIITTGHPRELLAQNPMPSKFSQLTPEQEKLEKSRQLPFHMHINLELVEAVYLVTSMLLEIPHMAAHPHDSGRRRMAYRMFRRYLDINERQMFSGPPENTRDNVMAATRALFVGDWQSATEYILRIRVWSLLSHVEDVKSMLQMRIREAALVTYVHLSTAHYSSFTLLRLAQMFDLPYDTVKSQLSKLIINDEIQATLDGVNRAVVMNTNYEPMSRLQWLAVQLSDKVSGLVEQNEKTVESRTAHAAGKDGRNQGQRGNALKLFKSPAEQLEKHLQRASVIDMLTSAGWVVSGLVRRDKTETVRLAIDKTLAKDKRRIVCGLILDKAILTLRDGATELHALHKSSGVPKLYADGSHTLPWSDTTSRTLSSSPSWLGGRMIANAEGTRVAFLDAHGFELLALDSVACQTLSDEEQLLGGCLAGRQLLLAQQTLALEGRAIIKFVRYEEAAAGDWKPVSNSKSAQVVLAARAASITFAPQTRTAKQQFLVCCDDGSLLCGLLSIQDNAQDEAQVLSKTRNVKSPALQAAFVINSDVLGAVHRDASFRLFDAALHDLPIVTEGKRMSPPQLSNMVSVSLRALGSQQQAVWQPRLLEEGVVDQDVYANVSCIVTLERSTPVLVRLELGSPVETQMWSLTTISRSLTVSDYGKVERVLSVLKEARHADCDEWIVSLSYIFRHLYVHGMLQQIEKQDLMLRLCDFDVPQYQREVDMIARKLVGILMSSKRYEVALGIALRRQQVDLLHVRVH